MTESDAAAGEPAATGSGSRAVRGRYAKFTGGMDVVLLEAILQNNPFTAKHGTRLQMWQSVAEIVGEGLWKNPEAYSWHTCRDRVTALLKLYADGKHDKLFKQGTTEENTRKEEILGELTLSIARKNKVGTPYPGVSSSSDSAAPAALGDTRGRVKAETSSPLPGASPPTTTAPTGLVMPDLVKRRRLDSGGSVAVAASSVIEATSPAAGSQQQPPPPEALTPSLPLSLALDVPGGLLPNGSDSAHLDSATFRARVLQLIENKVQFDAEQRLKEAEQREVEIELQKRLLECLQSK